MVTDLAAILFIRDRGRELQLLERCLRLEQQLHDLHTVYMRRAPHSTAVVQADAEIARLRNQECLTFQQIGARLGMPGSTVRYRYARSR